MTQSIVVQVGQCGNQIGSRFWDLALREHARMSSGAVFDSAFSSFFRNVDTRTAPPTEIPLGDGTRKVASLKARAVLIDMEEGVVNSLLSGPLRDVFDATQLITSSSGSGNNWAVGYQTYGAQYREAISDTIRRAAEKCDCLQSFFIIHSLGGGTGSGLGTYVLELLADDYPDVYRFVTGVCPSEDDDVITSPYNTVLAMRQLTEFADCVLPVENQALADICRLINKGADTKRAGSSVAESTGGVSGKQRAFDTMNNIVANMLLHMTSSSRFEGSLNVDINEITMNLVPFPDMHYLQTSLSPLYALADVALPPRRSGSVK